MNISYQIFSSRFGPLIVADHEGICALLLADETSALLPELAQMWPSAQLNEAVDESVTQRLQQAYTAVETLQLGVDLCLNLQGTSFQKQVWQALLKVPLGTTISYTELAQAIGRPKAVRAVAGACAANKIALLVPCHRVVRSDGQLSGYRWGVQRKAALLADEQALIAKTELGQDR